MLRNLVAQVVGDQIKAAYLPVESLAGIKADILRLRETERLNEMHGKIINSRYVFDFAKYDFVPKSIVILAVKFDLVELTFTYQGKRVKDLYCAEKSWVRDKMKQIFTENGYNLEYIFWLPQKRLAVCSGLAEYGRNNITYIDGWGSFFDLQTYITDAPCGEDFCLRKVCMMEVCDECGACINNCPTKALKADRYMIDSETCLCYMVEKEEPFPDWLPRSVVHSVYGCYRCQDVCPKNKQVLAEMRETLDFSDEETALLLAGAKRSDMPASLVAKLDRLGMEDWRLAAMPKNLAALFR